MKIHHHKQKLTLNIIALLIVLPIALMIYERLAPQNNHPSLVDKVESLIMSDAPKPNKEGDLADENHIPLDIDINEKTSATEPKATPKLSIKAAAQDKQVEVTDSIDIADRQRLRSIQQPQKEPVNKLEDVNKDIHSDGNNLDGEINLPNLSFKGELTEELMYLMLVEGKAKIISKSQSNGNHDYIIQGETLKQGRFSGLDSIDSLSDRSIELSESWDGLFKPRYQRATQNTIPSTFELRFTQSFNQYLAQQQLKAQEQAVKPIKETVFSFRIKNNRTVFELIKN